MWTNTNNIAPRGTNNTPTPCDQEPRSTEKRREFPQPLKHSRTTTRGQKQKADRALRVERFADPELESVRLNVEREFGKVKSYLLPPGTDPVPQPRPLNAPFVRRQA